MRFPFDHPNDNHTYVIALSPNHDHRRKPLRHRINGVEEWEAGKLKAFKNKRLEITLIMSKFNSFERLPSIIEITGKENTLVFEYNDGEWKYTKKDNCFSVATYKSPEFILHVRYVNE